jgi:hypothetical protein
MAYAPSLAQAILFGGWSDAAASYLGDTWTWQTGCWTRVQPSAAPSPREAMAMTYDPLRKVVFAFGGRIDPTMAQFSRETWTWDGKTWSLVSKDGPDLTFPSAAFDENSQRVLVYGWENGGIVQTWTWDGTQWRKLDVPQPPLRTKPGMAFDPASRRVILFGGLGNIYEGSAQLNDTWAWDGLAWSRLAPAHSPSPRQQVAMTSFAAKRGILLVGGNGRGKVTTDMWLWNGSDWIEVDGVTDRLDAPAIDIGSGVLMFGGWDLNAGGRVQRNDTVRWDGTKWIPA